MLRCINRRASRTARGITLLEVLIAMFILAVGLLSVAALIPVGKQQMIDASKFDRSTALARAAMNELQVRDMANYRTWRNYAGEVFAPTANATLTPPTSPFAWLDVDEPSMMINNAVVAGAPAPLVEYDQSQLIPSVPSSAPSWKSVGPLGRGNAVCIDPLLIANYPSNPAVTAWTLSGSTFNNPGIGVFPYPLKNDPFQDDAMYASSLIPDTWPNPPRMSRVTLSRDGGAFGSALTLPAARRIFTWQDEVVFNLPTDTGKRPTWSTVVDKGSSASSRSAIARQTADDYSWFATIVPSDASSSTSEQSGVLASVAVVYKRDLGAWRRGDLPPTGPTGTLSTPWNFKQPIGGQRPAPPERMVFVDVLGSGIGGGEMRLRLLAESSTYAQNDFPGQPEKSDLPAVKNGQWIMLCAWTRPDIGTASVPGPTAGNALTQPPLRRAAFRWYRVTQAGPLQYDANLFGDSVHQWFQNVTLSGPDWDPDQYLDGDGYSTGPNTESVLPHIGAGNGRQAFAILVQGVVAVYEQTITLD